MNSNELADIAVIGLAVMGQNLILNMNDHDIKVAAYNRTVSKVDDFLENEAKGTNVLGAHSLEEMTSMLKSPRKVMLMIQAGDAVDETIEKLIPLLDADDIIIDGGNSLYSDTARRTKYLESKNLHYIGTGISGGEEGARRGPAIMPGGAKDAWPEVSEIFRSIAAKADDGEPCCDWIGEGGAGHYVKMVHNGIEYGDMQLIAEAYQAMRFGLGMDLDEISDVFAKWNTGKLKSYLIEITAEILKFKDEDGSYLIDKIKDSAGQKGTGKWTVVDSAEMGQPVTLIAEAVFARCLSALKDTRTKASKKLHGPDGKISADKKEFLTMLEDALYASKIISYTQGFMLIRSASQEYDWKINQAEVASVWRAGCIIRSVFLDKIKSAFKNNPKLENLLLDDFFTNEIMNSQKSWRKVIAESVNAGIAVPCFSSALAFYDGFRSEVLPANILQAQRDFFGAHTYERLDKPAGEFFHTNWTGRGGDTASGTYNV